MKNKDDKSSEPQNTTQHEGVEPGTVEHSDSMDLQLFNVLLDNIPNYIYFKDTNSRFIKISKSHAKALGVSDPSDAMGKSDYDFFSNEYAKQAYQDEQRVMFTEEPVTKEEREIWPDRTNTWVISTKMPLRDKDGRIIGTFSISKDITEEKRIGEYIDDLQKEVGRTFHTLSATLLQVTHAIKPTINVLGPDPFKEKLLSSTDEVWKELVGPRNGLVSTLKKLNEAIETSFQKEALSPEDWAELENLLSLIEEVERVNIPEQRVSILRVAARRVIDIISKIKEDSLGQELVQESRHSAEQIERVTCLIALHQAQDRIIETDYMIRDLRERIFTGVKKTEEPKVCKFGDLVSAAVDGLLEYANYKGIDLRKDDRAESVSVLGGRHDIIRVMNNLLHNAIKYSWSRDQNVRPWIEIRSYIKGDQVCLEIEDYGIPIPRDEIEGDLIFQLGWRGRLSSQRGRIGTGIGLADARETARRYGGEVKITSRPATHSSSIDDLTVPHIKTAMLSLPIYVPTGK